MPVTDDTLDALKERLRPFEEAEAALVRAVLGAPEWLSEADEAALRYALNLARTTVVRAPDGTDVDLEGFFAPYREDVLSLAVPRLLGPSGVDKAELARLVPSLALHARAWRNRAAASFLSRLSSTAIDREVCEKALVLVAGGGGGVAWSYLGAFELLEQYDVPPRLLAGTSMGSVLLLFRARRVRWHPGDVDAALRQLSFRTLFKEQESTRWHYRV